MIGPAEFYEVGERLTRALISGDFDLYQTVMRLPLEINPIQGVPYTLRDTDALREDFLLYHQMNTLHHVTDIFRRILNIRMECDSVAIVTSRTELLSNSTRLVEPFDATHHLRRAAEGWRIFQIDSSVGHINWTLNRATITADRVFRDLPLEDDDNAKD